MNKKILYIDASNIVDGGGLNHLKNILTENQIFEKIIIWVNKNIQNNLTKQKNILIKTNYFINFSLLTRLFWQLFILPLIIKKNSILYIPGGFFLLKKTKTVIFIQNILPFTNLSFYKINYNFYNKIKNLTLKKLHLYSINKADHVIFPSKSSLKITLGKKFYKKNKNISVVYHGVSKNFLFKKKKN